MTRWNESRLAHCALPPVWMQRRGRQTWHDLLPDLGSDRWVTGIDDAKKVERAAGIETPVTEVLEPSNSIRRASGS